MCRKSWKSESLNLLEHSVPHRACNGAPLTLLSATTLLQLLYRVIHVNVNISDAALKLITCSKIGGIFQISGFYTNVVNYVIVVGVQYSMWSDYPCLSSQFMQQQQQTEWRLWTLHWEGYNMWKEAVIDHIPKLHRNNLHLEKLGINTDGLVTYSYNQYQNPRPKLSNSKPVHTLNNCHMLK
jgi:hypothetical protein